MMYTQNQHLFFVFILHLLHVVVSLISKLTHNLNEIQKITNMSFK